MNWINLKNHFGLERPYEFKYAIPFLLNLFLLCFSLLVVVYWVTTGKLAYGTVRFYFVVYLVIASIIGAIAARKPSISILVFLWLAVDVTIAFVTYIGSQYKLMASLMPNNSSISSRFEYHPLLQGVPKKNFELNGGVKIRHNKYGMRGGEPEKNKIVVNIFGGSSTYDVANGEGGTWVEKLKIYLGSDFTTNNFGVPGYSSAEHVIQTVFYEDVEGSYPKCAVYYMGWNDIRNSHVPDLDRAYADFHLLSQINNLQVRNRPIVEFSPLVGIVFKYYKSLLDTVPHPAEHRGIATYSDFDERLARIYERNIETISVVNKARGIRTIFVGQLLNKWGLKSNKPYGWLPYLADKDVWGTQQQFNQVLKKKAESLRDLYVDVDIEKFQESDFHDQGHFNSDGAEKFAKMVAPKIYNYCK